MHAAQQAYALVCHQQLTLYHCNHHIYACSSAALSPCLPSTADTASLRPLHSRKQLSRFMSLSVIISCHCITANHHICACSSAVLCGKAMLHALALHKLPSLEILQSSSQSLAGKSARKCVVQLWHTQTQLRSIFVSSMHTSAQHASNS